MVHFKWKILLGVWCLAATALAALNDVCIPTVPATCDFEHSHCTLVGNVFRCVCEPKYTPNAALSNCVGALGKKCVDSGKSCHSIPYALCDGVDGDYTCKCHSGYQQSASKSACEAVNMMDRCLEDDQCGAFHVRSTCVEERCVCPENTVQNRLGEKCIDNIPLDGTCEETAQCSENAVCRTNVCTCVDDNFVKVANSDGQLLCLPAANVVGDACQHKDQCAAKLGSAKCGANTKKCSCLNNFVESSDKTTCLKKAEAGGDCIQDVQCPSPEVCNFPQCQSPEPEEVKL